MFQRIANFFFPVIAGKMRLKFNPRNALAPIFISFFFKYVNTNKKMVFKILVYKKTLREPCYLQSIFQLCYEISLS